MQKLTDQLSHLEDVLGRITDAWTGSLSYLTNLEKIGYLSGIANEQTGVNQLDTLAEQLAYEKKMSITKEAYMPLFNDYIEKLVVSEKEATTDDVVETLETVNESILAVQDAIEKASFQN